MKKSTKNKKIIFLLLFLLLCTVCTPSGFAEGYTMKVLQKMEDLYIDKVFRIHFSEAIDPNLIQEKNGIEVMTLQNIRQDITLRLDPSNEKVLFIDPPAGGYAKEENFILYIHNSWKSKAGGKLDQGIQMEFSTTDSPTPSDFIFDKTTRTITGYRGNETHLVIPEQINNVPVEIIGELAFSELPIVSVSIPDSVTEIGLGAFYHCEQLTTLNLGNNVRLIADAAFINTNLKSLRLPDSVKTIGDGAFMDNNLTSLNLGSVEIIGDAAFSHHSLNSLVIPDSVISIGNFAFQHDFRKTAISTLILGRNLQHIGSWAFQGNDINSLILPDTVTFIGENSFHGNPISSLTIGSGLKTIPERAFMDHRLSYLEIPDTVERIEELAFMPKSDQQSGTVKLSKNLKYIGKWAFHGKWNLGSVILSKETLCEPMAFNPDVLIQRLP